MEAGRAPDKDRRKNDGFVFVFYFVFLYRVALGNRALVVLSSLCKLGWFLMHRDPPTSASLVLGLM